MSKEVFRMGELFCGPGGIACGAHRAVSDDGEIMGLKHKHYNIHGIQFHPESVLTPEGKRMINNWLEA